METGELYNYSWSSKPAIIEKGIPGRGPWGCREMMYSLLVIFLTFPNNRAFFDNW